MRPVLITLSLLLLVAVSLLTGVLAADWPFWHRAWLWHAAAPQPPAQLPGAHLRIESADEPRDLPVAADPLISAAVSQLLDDEGTEVLLVARDDRVLFEHYGAGMDAGVRIDGRELTLLPLVALYGAAAERGLGATLDGSIATQLDEWRDDARGEITPRLLLQGLSGLQAADGSRLNPFGKSAQLASGPNFEHAALRFQAAWPAGSHYAANPVDAQLAAAVLVRATNQPLALLLRDWLLTPLGLESLDVLLDHHRGAMAAHCCIQARARDWLTLGLLLAQEGEVGGRRVFSAQLVRQVAASSAVAPERGLGVRRLELGGGGMALLAGGGSRVLLADPASRTAWLWVSRGDLQPAQIDALLRAAAQGAAGQRGR